MAPLDRQDLKEKWRCVDPARKKGYLLRWIRGVRCSHTGRIRGKTLKYQGYEAETLKYQRIRDEKLLKYQNRLRGNPSPYNLPKLHLTRKATCQTDKKNKRKQIASSYKARTTILYGNPTPSASFSRKTATRQSPRGQSQQRCQ